MRRFLTRLILVPIALFFIFEAWLWDQLLPVFTRVIGWIPLRSLKAWLSRRIHGLSPGASFLVFLLPAIPLFPLKVFGLWLLGQGQWFLALFTIVFAKLVGMGITAFLFELTRPKLLLLPWFRVFYEAVLWLLAKARLLVDPIKKKIRRSLKLVTPGNAPRAWKLLMRIRGKANEPKQVEGKMRNLQLFGGKQSRVSVNAEIKRSNGGLHLRFSLMDPDKVVLDGPGNPGTWRGSELVRADQLWETTCFEAFWGEPGKPQYWELNLSTSGRFNLYRFDGYRTPQPPCASQDFSVKEVRVLSGCILEAEIQGGAVPLPATIEASLCVVVRMAQGCEYFSVRHAGARADFHLRESFCERP